MSLTKNDYKQEGLNWLDNENAMLALPIVAKQSFKIL